MRDATKSLHLLQRGLSTCILHGLLWKDEALLPFKDCSGFSICCFGEISQDLSWVLGLHRDELIKLAAFMLSRSLCVVWDLLQRLDQTVKFHISQDFQKTGKSLGNCRAEWLNFMVCTEACTTLLNKTNLDAHRDSRLVYFRLLEIWGGCLIVLLLCCPGSSLGTSTHYMFAKRKTSKKKKKKKNSVPER